MSEIKTRYNKFRIGGALITPEKPTHIDFDDFIKVNEITHATKYNVWQLAIDCRALIGKLLNSPDLKDFIRMDEKFFVLALSFVHPKFKDRLLIGGRETVTWVLFKNRKIETYFKHLEDWIRMILSGIQPEKNLLSYGKKNTFYGLKYTKEGILSYVIIGKSPYGDDEKYGQSYTEESWGYDE